MSGFEPPPLTGTKFKFVESAKFLHTGNYLIFNQLRLRRQVETNYHCYNPYWGTCWIRTNVNNCHKVAPKPLSQRHHNIIMIFEKIELSTATLCYHNQTMISRTSTEFHGFLLIASCSRYLHLGVPITCIFTGQTYHSDSPTLFVMLVA